MPYEVNPPNLSWEEERRAFVRQIFTEASTFMKKDNEIIGHFALITGSIAKFLQENPHHIGQLVSGTQSRERMDVGVGGSDTWSDLLDIIKEVLVKDKDFFLKLIGTMI